MKRELPLHDATFDGIVTSGTTSTLYFTRSSGEGCSVALGGVDTLHVDDFRQGNIAILFELTSGEAPDPHTDWDRLFPPPHPSAGEAYQSKHADFVRSKLCAIEGGDLTLVEMQPAYGASLLAVCRSVELQDYRNGR